MKRVCVVGHFGFGKELSNGQTIKTKTITSALETKLGCEQVDRIDTHGGIKNLPGILSKLATSFVCCKNIIIMPAQNGVKVFIPFCGILNHIFHRGLHYVVIGGWLPELLEEKPGLRKKLMSFSGIYVETAMMKVALEKQGLKNVIVMPNCKDLEIVEDFPAYQKPYRVCTFSRVMKTKGIEDAIDAVKQANQILGERAYVLDIYGQIESSEIDWFDELKTKFPDEVEYKGVIAYCESSKVLRDYFALLFPTYYEGEGFAGTAIDAFAAGVPVIATDWRYNTEIITDGLTGRIFKTHDVEQLTDCLVDAARNSQSWISMKKNCTVAAANYQTDKVINILVDRFK